MHSSIYHARQRSGSTPLYNYLRDLDTSGGYAGQLGVLAHARQLIVGLRTVSDGTDEWDDIFALVGAADDGGDIIYTEVTTDPGAFWLGDRAGSKRGTAILQHDRLHQGAWVRGFHKGDPNRPALVQHGGPVSVWRDDDHDGHPTVPQGEDLPLDSGYFGINFHSTRPKPVPPAKVGSSSAGCQVFRYPEALDDLLSRLSPDRRISYLLVPGYRFSAWFEARYVADPALLRLGVS